MATVLVGPIGDSKILIRWVLSEGEASRLAGKLNREVGGDLR